MPFTATQTLELINGQLKPSSNLFIDLVRQVGLENAIAFYEAPKVIPPLSGSPTQQEQEDYDNRVSYEDKFYGMCNSIINSNEDQVKRLVRLVSTQFSKNYSYNVFTNGVTDAFWETKTTEQINTAMEFLAKIRLAEKTAYDSIV